MAQAFDQPYRIAQLDALRGIAVIGIALMNVYVFALPAQGYYNPAYTGDLTATDRWVWIASFVFVEDKFRTLFAIMFGAGCLILLERSSERRWRGHFARMSVLLAIGIAHSIVLASNDVLRVYAMAGCAIPLLFGLSHRALYVIAIGLIAAHVGFGMVVFGSGLVDHFGGRAGTDAVLFAERNFGSDPAAVQASLERGGESLTERVARRASAIPTQLMTLFGAVPLNLAAISLGMALWRDQMLSGKWPTFRLQRLAAICALLALPALFGLAAWIADEGFPGPLVGSGALVLSTPFDVLLGLSYAALVMALLAPDGKLTSVLAAVGRLSLTNYLMTSVVFAWIFASWGLGWFGQVSRGQALALSLVPILGMLLWSGPWLRLAGKGPFEKLWRGAARLLS